MPTISRLLYVIIPILVIAVYSNSFNADWHFDDRYLLDDKFQIRDLSNAVKNLLYKSRAVVDLSFAINYAVHEYSVTGYHIINIALHICSVMAFLWLISLIFTTPAGKDDKNLPVSTLIAFFTALIFAVHPAHTQAVTYIVQRYTILVAIFYFCTLSFYIKFRIGREKRLLFYLASIFFALLAVHSKPNAATLPVALLLVEAVLFKISITDRKMFMRLMPFIILAALVPLRLFASGYLYEPVEEVIKLSSAAGETTGWQGMLAQFHVVFYYVKFTLFPTGLAIVHDFPVIGSVFHPSVIAAYAVSAVTLIFAYRIRHDRPVLSFGLFFFFLAPVIEFYWPDRELFYDHWIYLASTGMILAFVYTVFTLANRIDMPDKAVVIALTTVVILLAVSAYGRNDVWKTEVGIWREAVEKSPGNMKVYNNYGKALAETGNLDDAMVQYKKAISMEPNYVEAHANLGVALAGKKKVEEAVWHFLKALKIQPDNSNAHYNLGYVLARNGKLEEAIHHLSESVRLRPNFAKGHNNLGLAYFQSGKLKKAIRQYNRALDIRPKYAKAHYNLALALIGQDRLDEAVSHLGEVLKLMPNHDATKKLLRIIKNRK